MTVKIVYNTKQSVKVIEEHGFGKLELNKAMRYAVPVDDRAEFVNKAIVAYKMRS